MADRTTPTNRRRRRRAPLVAAIVVVAALVVGAVLLFHHGGGSSSPAGAATASSPKRSAHDSATSKSPSGDNGSLQDAVGARSALRGFTCAPRGSAWSASMTVANDADKAATYVIDVSVYKKKTGTVVGAAHREVAVAAHGHKRIAVSRVATAKPKGVACTVRAVSGH